MRHVTDQSLLQIFIAFPVSHHSVIHFSGCADLLIKAGILKSGERICHGCKAGTGTAEVIVLRASFRNILAAFHTAFHGNGKDHVWRKFSDYVLAEAVNVDHPLHDIVCNLQVSFLHLFDTLHIVQVAGMYLALLSVVWILAIIKSHVQTNGVEYRSVRRDDSVTLCIFISGSGNLLASDQCVVAGILQCHAKFFLHGWNDNFVIVVKRNTAAAFCGLDRTFHQ